MIYSEVNFKISKKNILTNKRSGPVIRRYALVLPQYFGCEKLAVIGALMISLEALSFTSHSYA